MSSRVSKPRHRRLIGRGIKDFMSKANDFLKKTKLLSTIGNTLNQSVVPLPFRGIGQKVIDYGVSKGYGRRKIRGRGLRLAGGSHRGIRGGALNPVGGMLNRQLVQRSSMARRLPSYF